MRLPYSPPPTLTIQICRHVQYFLIWVRDKQRPALKEVLRDSVVLEGLVFHTEPLRKDGARASGQPVCPCPHTLLPLSAESSSPGHSSPLSQPVPFPRFLNRPFLTQRCYLPNSVSTCFPPVLPPSRVWLPRCLQLLPVCCFNVPLWACRPES